MQALYANEKGKFYTKPFCAYNDVVIHEIKNYGCDRRDRKSTLDVRLLCRLIYQ